MRHLAVGTIVLSFVVLGCNGNGNSDTTTTVGATVATPPTQPAGTYAGDFGITEELIMQDNYEVFDGFELHEDGLVETDAGGNADFTAVRGSSDCVIGRSSEILASPSSSTDIVLKVNLAPSSTPVICAVGVKQDVEFEVGDEVKVTALDPVLSFVFDGEAALIKSLYGFARVESRVDNDFVLLGPNRQVVVPVGEIPQIVERADFVPFELERVEALIANVPEVNASDSIVESRTLLLALDQGELLVGYESTAATGDDEEFLAALGPELSQRLGIGVEFVPEERAIDTLRAGGIDLALTPDSLEDGADLISAGLYTDDQGRVWELHSLLDEAFQTEWSNVWAAALLDGVIDGVHGEFFELPLDYGAVFAARPPAF